MTVASRGPREQDYNASSSAARQGRAIGVLARRTRERAPTPSGRGVHARARRDEGAGRTIVDTARSVLTRCGAAAAAIRSGSIWSGTSPRAARTRGETVDAIVRSGKTTSVGAGSLASRARDSVPLDGKRFARTTAETRAFSRAVTALMDSLKLDALVYPTWSNPPRLIGDSTRLAATTARCFHRDRISRDHGPMDTRATTRCRRHHVL